MQPAEAPGTSHNGWQKWVGCPVLVLSIAASTSAQTANSVPPINPSPPRKTISPQDARERDATQKGSRRYGVLEILRSSVFARPLDPVPTWTPLTLGGIADGWWEPWIAPPSPTGGSVRQGWVGSFDAFFNRMLVGAYSVTNAIQPNRSEHNGVLMYETPVTRRYMFGLVAPFVNRFRHGADTRATTFGDLVVENRFLVNETRNATVSFNLNLQLPTGDAAMGGHRTSINPYAAFFQDLGWGFSVRGAVGADIPLDSKPDGVDTTLIGQLGMGQTLTPHDTPFLADFTYYAVVNYRAFLGAANSRFVSITPGFRTHLGSDFWLLGGIDIPVSNPRPFQERFNIVLVKGF